MDNSLAAIRADFEDSLENFVRSSTPSRYNGMLEMVAYQMGWAIQGGSGTMRGKRVRPLLVLLAAQASDGDKEKTMPAAWAVELIHNFSLIHDDIEDQSQLRHGNPTIWVKWGVAQAINLGDFLFNLANCALNELRRYHPPEVSLEAALVLSEACTHLTGGQYLDLSYERDQSISLDDYIPMIYGKTAALLSAAAELGAVCAGASETVRTHLREYGSSVGLAFQMWDDWLGIWGDSVLTGKSSESDLVSGKKTMPILFSLKQNKRFARRWIAGPIQEHEVMQLSELLTQEGAREYSEIQAKKYTTRALASLSQSGLKEESTRLLRELTESLLNRHN